MAKEIPLTQGQVAIVDDEDHEWLSQYKWCCARRRAARGVSNGKGSSRMHFMHNYIMSPPPGYVVDHINGDGLDNRRSNLRICTQAENLRNRGKFRGKRASIYKGVSRSPKSRINPWVATIKIDGKIIRLGSFPTENDAALAYNEAALRYHGKFARLNTIKYDMSGNNPFAH